MNFWKLGGGGLQNPQDPLDTGLVYTYASRLPRLVIANAVDFDHERGHGPSDIGGDAIETRRHVPPQILGSGGTLWSMLPPISAARFVI